MKAAESFYCQATKRSCPTYTADPIHNVLTNDGIGDHAGTTPHVL